MKTRTNIIAMAFALVVWGAAAPAQQPVEVMDSAYGVIASKSIFLKDRRAPEPEVTIPTPPPVPPEEQFVLRGVAFVDGVFHAHVEGMDRKTTILRVGDSIAGGEVAEIRIDGISYRNTGTGRSVWVGPGRNLTGAVSNLREQRR